jgi:flagellar hook-associated protein 2
MSATSSSTASALSLSGLASGINWTSIVSEMLTVEAAPETQMNTEETADEQKNTAYQTIGTDLTNLKNDVATLTAPGFFNSRTTALSNSSVANATAASGTPLGNYTFKVTTLASDAVQVGATASGPLSPTDDVSNLTLSSAGFANPVTAGTFTVNGQTITVATSDTLQSVFNQISTATGGAVTASYNATAENGEPADTITLSGSSPITLGSDTDTSNFLQAAELYNNGGDSVTSAGPLGGINLSDNLDDANTATQITDGGSGQGKFLINGVPITYNASTASVTDVLQEINDSTAGVTATYDSLDNRFELTDTTAGNVGISLQDVTGNFLAATGLSSGTLQAGNDLQYSINGGGTLTSQSNTIDAGSSGITGLSITALDTGTTTISVNSDTSTISSAINSLVTDYNTVQNYISGQTATSTSSTGTVTPGLLTGDMDAEGIMTNLRQLFDASPGTTSGVENLNDLGIQSNGNDNTLSISNTTTLDNALTNNLSAVQNLFTNPTNGLATTLNSYLTNVTGPNGELATDEKNMTSEAKTIATSISTLQTKISNDQTTLDDQFTTMETAIESINTEKEVLNDYFSSSSSSASDQSAPTAAGSGTSSASTS